MSPRSVPSRRAASLNRGWWFVPRPVPAEAGSAVPDDAQEVSLPHPTVILPAQGFDDAAYQVVSTYRRRLRLPAEAAAGRVVVEFGGAMTAATVSCNGHRLAEQLGGFVPLRVELTSALRFDGDDVLTVEVDSRERADVPPFGGHLDYLTFGGLYRTATLTLLPRTFLDDVVVRAVDVLGPQRRLEVTATTGGDDPPPGAGLVVDVLAGPTVVASGHGPLGTGVSVTGLERLRLWDVDDPARYDVRVRLVAPGDPGEPDDVLDGTTLRTGLRDARFTDDDGFHLNGRRVVLRGLNRHQTYPHVGAAMPARMQRADARVLRHELGCNAVRTAHYPQDPAFLDACDELGLLVFEEMPGWQHVGDRDWQDLACRDVAAMVRRDRHHPSIVLWGVRVNESMDHDAFYRRTNAIAHDLDPTRQTSGVRYFRESHLLEDVFALNDFEVGGVIHPPNHPRYLVSEYAGHMFPTKRHDNTERVQDHAALHLTVLEALHADRGIAGGFGWCAFDYATHAEFGSGDRVCHHGVADAFRVPKAAGWAYRSQLDPGEQVVLEPAFVWAAGDHSNYGGPGMGLILSNCDRVVVAVDGDRVAELLPDRARFPQLPHPPFTFGQTSGIAPWRRSWGELRLDGYLGDRLAITRRVSGRGVDADLVVTVDDDRLVADGADTTRLLVRVTDEYGNDRPFTVGAVSVELDGPLTLIGGDPAPLVGGIAGAWLRAGTAPGRAVVRVRHPWLGVREVTVEVDEATAEPW